MRGDNVRKTVKRGKDQVGGGQGDGWVDERRQSKRGHKNEQMR